MGKVQKLIEVDSELIGEVEAQGLDVAVLFDRFLRSSVKPAADDRIEQARRWREENREALAHHAERIEREGVFGEEWRRW
jgi:antitoxin CcdA